MALGAIALPVLTTPAWGFFGHKVINRQAVFSLPYPLRQHFIHHTDYLSAHAVDADKRRYATKTEAYQHYFDSEKWQPYLDLQGTYDRRHLADSVDSWFALVGSDTLWNSEHRYSKNLLLKEVPRYFTGIEWLCGDTIFIDTMIRHGILPLAIIRRYHMLRRAFMEKDESLALRHAADLGHYIGDAHVPLHTTQNYNGQLTGQLGIHAFWETSIPELLVDSDFDLIVGRAEYIENVPEFVWALIRESHGLVDEVLQADKTVREEWPDDRETCPIERNGQTVFRPCPDLTKAYDKALDGMVEEQMRKAIKVTASLWWTAYVDAGQPDLRHEKTKEKDDPQEGKEITNTVDCDRK